MSASLKSIALVFFLLLAFFLPLLAWSRYANENENPSGPTPHAMRVIERYCLKNHKTLNPTIDGPLIMPLDERALK